MSYMESEKDRMKMTLADVWPCDPKICPFTTYVWSLIYVCMKLKRLIEKYSSYCRYKHDLDGQTDEAIDKVNTTGPPPVSRDRPNYSENSSTTERKIIVTCPMMYLACCTAARAQSTLVPKEQKPCLSGGDTCNIHLNEFMITWLFPRYSLQPV